MLSARTVRWRLLVVATSGLLALTDLSCSHDCKQSGSDPIEFRGGTVDATGTFYESSPWDGQFLHFPAGRRYRLFHNLGARPIDVNTYLSFAESALGTGHNVSESAGNQAVIEAVTAEHVEVRNDTCAEFWLRVTAQSPPQIADAGTD